MEKTSDFIRVYENAFSTEFCEKWISYFDQKPSAQSRNGKDIHHHLQNSSWSEMDLNKHFAEGDMQSIIQTFNKYKTQYEQDCGLSSALPPAKGIAPFIMKRYDTNGSDCFEPHFDAYGPRINRFLVLLIYLNDVAEGGETEFPDLDIGVKPKQGSLLIFPPSWMYLHKANIPKSNPKYILSTYYLWW